MKGSTEAYRGKKVAQAVAMASKSESETIPVTMRQSGDVPAFLKKLRAVKKETRQNALHFG